MFLITARNTGEFIGVIDKPRFICRDSDTGICYSAAVPSLADGIAVNGKPYNFGTTEKMKDFPFVDAIKVDGSEFIQNLRAKNIALQTELTETQQALTESYEENAALNDELTLTQLALTELYEKFN